MAPRMRTAAGVLEIIKEQDPGTEVSLHYIRCIIHSGKLPIVPVGRKKLVDADAVIAYLAAGEPATANGTAVPSGGVRRVQI